MKLFLEQLKLAFLVFSSPVILLIMLIIAPVLSVCKFKALGERIIHTLREQGRKAGFPPEE